MRDKSRYIVFQLSGDHDELAGLTYNELKSLQKKGPDLYEKVLPDLSFYLPVYAVALGREDTIGSVLDRLLRSPPEDFPGRAGSKPVIRVSDVIVMIAEEFATAWYVDKTDKKSGGDAVLIPNFCMLPGTEKLIRQDGGKYAVGGKEGQWTPVHEMCVSGIPFYEMEKSRDPKAMHVLLSFNRQIVADHFERLGPGDDWIFNRIGVFLGKWLKYFQTGRYISLRPEDLKSPDDEEADTDEGRRYSLDEFVAAARDEKNLEIRKQHDEQEKAREDDRIAARLAEQRAAGDLGDSGSYTYSRQDSDPLPVRQVIPENTQLEDQLSAIFQQIRSMSSQVDWISRTLSERKTLGE